MAVHRDRFVRVMIALMVLLLTALIATMVLLPDRLGRIAQFFLG